MTPPSLRTVAAQWGRLGCIGFGGPPAHIRLLRQLCVERRRWIDEQQFEDAIATANLLPGPSSTQLAIFCAWRVRGRAGALVGGAGFILPGLILILALSGLFLADSPPHWVLAAGAGAGSAVAAVAVQAGWALVPASWQRRAHTARWIAYLLAGGAAAALLGPWVVLVLVGCGLLELTIRLGLPRPSAASFLLPMGLGRHVTVGLLGTVIWTSFKVGALSYGGGFVIIPLMQSDAVDRYHWMTDAQFLNAVALGQVTPGPVVHTVAVVGFAAAGVGGGLLAALMGFGPSFAFILLGAQHFDRIRSDRRVRAFLDGAGPAAIGAILGSSIPLARALDRWWQFALLAAAAFVLLVLRRGVVLTLLGAGIAGVLFVEVFGAPLPS